MSGGTSPGADDSWSAAVSPAWTNRPKRESGALDDPGRPPLAGRAQFCIIHAAADRAWAQWVSWELEEAGYRVVIQPWESRPAAERFGGPGRAERTIALLSPALVGSGFRVADWEAAAADSIGEASTLVAVRVAEFSVEEREPAGGYVDLAGTDEDTARQRLLAALRSARTSGDGPGRVPAGHAAMAAPRFPGAMPPVWNMPYQRNPNFVGRQEVLFAATSGSPRSAAPRAVAGLGGIGKTQLAIEYAYRRRGDFDVVWWVRAEDPATALHDYAELGRALRIAPEADLAGAARAVRQWLERNDRWLVILDDAVGPEAAAELIPRGGGGQLLITSRSRDWAGIGDVVALDVLREDEAVALLCRRSGEVDEVSARALARELGYLPLALEQAAAYMAQSPGLTVRQYLELFRARPTELLSRARPHSYPATVATTWALSLEAVERESPGGVALLRACAFLDPDDIPLSWLVAAELPEPLQFATDPLALADALAVLGRYSLISGSNSDDVRVHRLVQLMVRDAIGEEGRRYWAGAVLRIMANAFPAHSSDVPTWPRCARLLPHALVAAAHAERSGVEAPATSWLLDRAGFYLAGRGQFDDARVLLERALAVAEAEFGPRHPEVGHRLNDLALVMLEQGDGVGARRNLERARAIAEESYGDSHAVTGTRLNNLALVLQSIGAWTKAYPMFERALVIAEATGGPGHPTVAVRLNNLAAAQRNVGEPELARATFQRALEMELAIFGPNDPRVAVVLNNLAMALQDMGDHDGARQTLERALAIDEAAYGADHPNVATDLNNLASVLRDLGDHAAAREGFKRALAIDEAAHGPEHPNVGRDLNNLATVLRDLRDLDGAREGFERAVAIAEAAHGSDHPDVGRHLTNLATVQRDLRDVDAARLSFARALRIAEAANAPGDPSTEALRAQYASVSTTPESTDEDAG